MHAYPCLESPLLPSTDVLEHRTRLCEMMICRYTSYMVVPGACVSVRSPMGQERSGLDRETSPSTRTNPLCLALKCPSLADVFCAVLAQPVTP